MNALAERDPYLEFLRAKVCQAQAFGFEISPDDVNPILKPHQRAGVVWSVAGGRRALFESFGLGKSVGMPEYLLLFRKPPHRRRAHAHAEHVAGGVAGPDGRRGRGGPCRRGRADAVSAKTSIECLSRVFPAMVEPAYFLPQRLAERDVLRRQARARAEAGIRREAQQNPRLVGLHFEVGQKGGAKPHRACAVDGHLVLGLAVSPARQVGVIVQFDGSESKQGGHPFDNAAVCHRDNYRRIHATRATHANDHKGALPVYQPGQVGQLLSAESVDWIRPVFDSLPWHGLNYPTPTTTKRLDL